MNEDKFAKGDVITPSSPRSVLEYGKTYIVTEYVQSPEGDVVFVEDDSDKRKSVTVSAFLNWMRRGMGKKRCPTCNNCVELR